VQLPQRRLRQRDAGPSGAQSTHAVVAEVEMEDLTGWGVEGEKALASILAAPRPEPPLS